MARRDLNFEHDLIRYIRKLDVDGLDVNAVGATGAEHDLLMSQIIEPIRLVEESRGFEFSLERILHAAFAITKTEIGFISLKNSGNKLEYKIGRNRQNNPLAAKDFDIHKSLISQCVKSGMPVRNSEENAASGAASNRPNVLVAPFFLHTDLVGILHLQSNQPILSATHAKWRMFQVFLEHAALAIRNAQFYKLQNDFESEKATLQNTLIQSDNLAMKGTMAAKIGHEINNYLSGINANIEMATDLLLNKAKKGSIIERLEKAQEMINNMAALSSSLMAKGGFEANVEKSSLNKVVNKFVDFVKPIYKCSDVVIEKKLDTNIPDVEIDGALMIQVLFNIVKNAVEAKADARIVLSSRLAKDKRNVELEILDNGPGISPEKQAKIFEPLFTDKANGHGYGLAICRDIVKKHNGDIRVKSKPGEGTSFIIRLPLNVKDDYADVEFDVLERLEEEENKRSLRDSIRMQQKRTTIVPPYRPIYRPVKSS